MPHTAKDPSLALHHVQGDNHHGTSKTWEVHFDQALVGRLYRLGPAGRPTMYRFDPAAYSGLEPQVFDRLADARARLGKSARAAAAARLSA